MAEDRMLSDEILLGLINKNSGGGGGGTTNYNSLSNKPQIAGTELQGNKSLADLGIASAQDVKVKDVKVDNASCVDENGNAVVVIKKPLTGKVYKFSTPSMEYTRVQTYLDDELLSTVDYWYRDVYRNPVTVDDVFTLTYPNSTNWYVTLLVDVIDHSAGDVFYWAFGATPSIAELDCIASILDVELSAAYAELNNAIKYNEDAIDTIKDGQSIDSFADVETALASKADLTDLAPAFSTATAYTVGQYVSYDGNLYKCISAHSAGAWAAGDFTLVAVGSELESKQDTLTFDDTPTDNSNNPVKSNGIYDALATKTNTDMVAADFNAGTSYTAGNYCVQDGKLYKFKNNHSGAWSSVDVDEVKITGELSALKSGLTNIVRLIKNYESVTIPSSGYVTLDSFTTFPLEYQGYSLIGIVILGANYTYTKPLSLTRGGDGTTIYAFGEEQTIHSLTVGYILCDNVTDVTLT